MKHQDLIARLSLREKAKLCTGQGNWHMKRLSRFGIPSITMTDGPSGLHPLKGITKNASCAPSSSTTANSWDPAVTEAIGDLVAIEALRKQISIVLGPGVNMKRSPLCGRNFEYYSEDPLLAGEMACGFVTALQSHGVGASLKHFAANNQETNRMGVNVRVDERALREIYLPAFEQVVRKAKPWTVMCAYNSLNGDFCSENHWLLTKILREEWGYEGVLLTDWGACHDRVKGLLAGQDLTMPSYDNRRARQIVRAVKEGRVPKQVLDKTVDRLLELMLKCKQSLRPNTHFSWQAHHAKLRELAGQCIVLLKNENALLPLKTTDKIALIGEMAKAPRFQGDGSARVAPKLLDNAYDTMLQAGIPFVYEQGYRLNGAEDHALIESACRTAAQVDKAVLFLGLTDEAECEGRDRTTLAVPENQIRLLRAVYEANPNTIVVLAGGAPVETPWLSEAGALLFLGLCGEASGSAAVDTLYGKRNPSGKLAETWPLSLRDTPCNYFPGDGETADYRESIYIGYRYYDHADKAVRFPFGFGLSYTSFEYSSLRLDKKKMRDDETLTVRFTVKNAGNRDGAEIAQLYVADRESTVFRAPKELRGFEKVFLKAGESKEVTLPLSKRAFAYYHVGLGDWHVETGAFDILVGGSSRSLPLRETVLVESTAPNAPLMDLRPAASVYYSGDVQNVEDDAFEHLLRI